MEKHPVFVKRGRLRQMATHVLACCFFLSVSVGCGQTGPIDFNIPSQEIIEAIDVFVETTGFSLIHTVGGQVDIKTNEVLGKYTPDEALSIMLEGTGLVHKITGNRRREF
ncbi:MAG: STN domain-containing protein [Deltaproteobacteria bacterium]|nr:STN domain-containing protein [Deltaproteobacteria bacterium]